MIERHAHYVPGSTFLRDQDGHPFLVPEMFELYDTYGLPFAISFDECFKRGMYPDWVDLVRSAHRADWSAKKLTATVCEAIREVFGPKLPYPEQRFRELVAHYYGSANGAN